jgi:DNA polymerase-4
VEREILHIAIPSFPIALARSNDPALRNRPVAIAPGNSQRALIQCVSPEARAEGIHVAMPVFKARRLCPAMVIIAPDTKGVTRGTQIMAEACGEFTPIVEPAAGRMFLDLTGSRTLFGPACDVAARLEKILQQRLGVIVTAGSGINKLVSRIAADVLPEPGVYDVIRGSERHFIAPFPLSVLPGIGSEREALLLRDLNLKYVHQLAALPLHHLRLVVGAFAPLLHERACGIDRTPVHPVQKQPEIMEDAYLSEEEHDDHIILAELYRLVETCGMKLRCTGKQAATMTLSISYADGITNQRSTILNPPSTLDLALFHQAEKLFTATCQRRVRVRSIRLACGSLKQQQQQMELFPAGPETAAGGLPLQTALDCLRKRYGTETVRWGRTVTDPPGNFGRPATPCAEDLSAYRYCTQTTRGK